MRALFRTTISAAALVTALAGGLTACGDDSGTAADPGTSSTSTSPSTTSTTPSDEPTQQESSATPTPDGPACATVWKDGATLARGYAGCVAQGAFVERDLLACSSGQRIARYDDHFYAAMGGRIYRTESVLEKDRGYRHDVAVCRG